MTSKPVGAPSYLTLPIFPSSSSPRVWVITSASSPLAIAVARAVLDHGDSAVLGLTKPIDGVDVPGSLKQGGVGRDASALLAGEEKRDSVFRRFWAGMRETSAKDRCRAVVLDGRYSCAHNPYAFASKSSARHPKQMRRGGQHVVQELG